MLRDEFILFDTFKNINLITFFMCLLALILGCKGKFASRMQNSWVSKKSMKCCGGFTLILIVLGICLAFQMKEMKKVLIRNKENAISNKWKMQEQPKETE